MAEETKKQETEETKKTSAKKTEEPKPVSDEQMAFNNKQLEMIRKLTSENATLKDAISKQKKSSSRRSGGSSIVGLQGLRGFGRK